MPGSDAPPLTRGVVLRGFGLVVALGLTAVGVWMIAVEEGKDAKIGVIVAFWGLLIGAFALYGRRYGHPMDYEQAVPPPPEQTGSAVELRKAASALERAEEAANRREFERRLEQMLRHEIQASVSREVATMRAEIAQLRSELVEKVGGQLRLERIETTRLIGSDLEALQHEVRQLKHATRETDGLTNGAAARARAAEAAPVRQIVEPARVRPVSRQTAEVEDAVQPARASSSSSPPPPPPPAPRLAAPAPAPEPARPIVAVAPTEETRPIRLAPEPPAAPPPAAAPTPAAPAPAAPALAPAAPAPPATPAAAAAPPPPPPPVAPPPPADDFASLPRLRPFTDFELDPIDDESDYTGRRRRTERVERPEPTAEPPGGRHAQPNGDPSTGRRHRRAEEGGDHDLLARLLERESSRR